MILGYFIALAPWILVAAGLVALVGGHRCYADPDRAGVFAHPAAAVIAVTFLLGMGTPIGLWFASGPGRDRGWGSAGYLIVGLSFVAGIMMMFAPLLAYHLTRVLGKTLVSESQPPPDPEDPFERAKAAEERGDSRSAIERYAWVLENEPSHFDARARLADLLARTGRSERAKGVLDEGIALTDAEGWMRSKWRELRQRIEERSLGEEEAEGDRPTFKALGDVRPARLKAWETRPTSGKDNADDDGPLDASSLEDEPR
jgi:hypothetical protein